MHNVQSVHKPRSGTGVPTRMTASQKSQQHPHRYTPCGCHVQLIKLGKQKGMDQVYVAAAHKSTTDNPLMSIKEKNHCMTGTWSFSSNHTPFLLTDYQRNHLIWWITFGCRWNGQDNSRGWLISELLYFKDCHQYIVVHRYIPFLIDFKSQTFINHSVIHSSEYECLFSLTCSQATDLK